MNKKYEYSDGQKIYFNIDGRIKGWGFIRGCTGDFPTIGKQWIVQAEEPAPYDTNNYPFPCLSVFSVQIKNEPFELDSNPLEENIEEANDATE